MNYSQGEIVLPPFPYSDLSLSKKRPALILSNNGLIPSINLSGEMGIFPTGDVGLLAVGAIVAYKYSTYSHIMSDYNYSQFTIGPRAIWHLHTFESDQWDAYAGAGAGIRFFTDYEWNYTYMDKKASALPYVEAFVGGRMMLNDGFGLFAEAGYGTLSAIKVGATLKF